MVESIVQNTCLKWLNVKRAKKIMLKESCAKSVYIKIILLTLITFVDVNVTLRSDVATGTLARVTPIDLWNNTVRSLVTRIGCTSIVQVTKETSLVRRTFTNEAGHAVMTFSSVETGFRFTVIHIDLAIVTLESVDTDAGITSIRVMTRGSVLAYVWPRLALVDVLCTITSSVLRRAVTCVRAYPINATASILA